MDLGLFYHTNGSGLRTSQKHQLCEVALTNVWDREAQIEEKRGIQRRRIVCQCLCQGLNMRSGRKHEAYCLCCGFQFQWQNKLQEFLLVRKTAFAYVYLSRYLMCVYAQLQNSNPHTWRSMYSVYILAQGWLLLARAEPGIVQTKSREFSPIFSALVFDAMLHPPRSVRPNENLQTVSRERIKMIYHNGIPSIFKKP